MIRLLWKTHKSNVDPFLDFKLSPTFSQISGKYQHNNIHEIVLLIREKKLIASVIFDDCEIYQ